MTLNDLLKNKGLDPQRVLVMRHRPQEPELNRVLPWLAAERPEIFNAYQQTQGEKLEKTMNSLIGHGHVASFIGHEPGKALFVGLYSIDKSKPLTIKEYWKIPAYIEMKAFGVRGYTEASGRRSLLWFDLSLTNLYSDWKGKLVVRWPPPERSWWRRAHLNDIAVQAILEDSALDAAMPSWESLVLSWDQLALIPTRWKAVLSQWRGIYYIFDGSDGRAMLAQLPELSICTVGG